MTIGTPFYPLGSMKAPYSSPQCMLGLCFAKEGDAVLPREGFLLYITVLTLAARV